jgi:hypothetical protein
MEPARSQEEYPETPHPNPSLLRPHYGTDIENKDNPEKKKYNN